MNTQLEGEFVWLITGASRGVGLEMTKQLLQSPSNTVIATCRAPPKATALQALNESAGTGDRLYIVALDVSNSQSISDSAQEVEKLLGERGIDYLVNNAAINSGGSDTAFTLDLDILQEVFQTNVAGPVYIAQRFLPLIEKGRKKTIVNISTTVRHPDVQFGTPYASYCISKAALNMLTYKQAKERPDITAISICPGWLKTDMGTENATYPVSVGVAGMLKVISSFTPSESGQYFNFKGERLQW